MQDKSRAFVAWSVERRVMSPADTGSNLSRHSPQIAHSANMSTWDQCCKGGKFNANFAKTRRTVETLRKIEKNPKENEKTAFPENADKKGEDFARVKDATNVEIQLSFSELGLNSCLLKWIEALGFSSPNRVQNEVLYRLSEMKSRHNVIKAPEKSGKTTATLLWVLNKLLCDKNKEYPKALMICPTYEIANKNYKIVEQIPKYCEIKIHPAMKRKKINKGEQATADLVIATPDKALELSKTTFNLKTTKYLIVDDAHFMSGAEGHLKTLSHVCSLLSTRCHIILCTLFCNKVLDDFIDKFLMQNQMIEIKNDLKKVIPKEIFIVYSSNEERIKAFICLEKRNSFKGQTVVFCKTREELNRLKSALDDENISVEILNGKLKPPKRTCILQQFKQNEIKLLIATYTFMEVLEAENVTKVINYEQVLNDETKKLNFDIYNQIENRLNGRENCLIGSFIEQKWEDVLIQPQPGATGEQVYANARNISANDLINGQKF
ncbi:ATP-dependent RNA helicase DDX19A [Araneus ventricosus]|uniref:RNA helicase n=1 Tax=Araneus ventricosus TaxID=182803 RepID=A0A4Y2C4Y9_ARAVE|nr:ATP-dependent RNA helicase DDX19A [Araneus ventricosus]